MEQDSKCCLVADEGDAKRTLISELEGGTPPSRRCREEGSALFFKQKTAYEIMSGDWS
eukprot:COSAG01_NODE_49904_length_368_cov_0.717472_1_plen_57_part_10